MGPLVSDTKVKYSTAGCTMINICEFLCAYCPLHVLNLMDKFQLHFIYTFPVRKDFCISDGKTVR